VATVLFVVMLMLDDYVVKTQAERRDYSSLSLLLQLNRTVIIGPRCYFVSVRKGCAMAILMYRTSAYSTYEPIKTLFGLFADHQSTTEALFKLPNHLHCSALRQEV
jgi:hypothetical protein